MNYKQRTRSLWDCMNAKCYNGRIRCNAGHKLNKHTRDGSIPDTGMLNDKELMYGVCADCRDFDDMDKWLEEEKVSNV